MSEEIAELIAVVYKPLKKALVDLAREYWNPKWAKMIATNVAAFYRTLREQGIDEEFAKELTKIHVMNAKLLLEGIGESTGQALRKGIRKGLEKEGD